MPLRFALAATMDEHRRVMVEGTSGLLEIAGRWVAEWHATLGRLRFVTGAEAVLFSGACPHLLRGPDHHYAWCDELAKWEKPQETWDMLQFGLRLGSRPRALVTTTPRPGPVLKAIMDDPDTIVPGGATRPTPFAARVESPRRAPLRRHPCGPPGARRRASADAAGELWTVELIERLPVLRDGSSRRPLRELLSPPQDERDNETPLILRTAELVEVASEGPAFTRTLIAVDPNSATALAASRLRPRRRKARTRSPHPRRPLGHRPLPKAGPARSRRPPAAHGTSVVVAEANQGARWSRPCSTPPTPTCASA